MTEIKRFKLPDVGEGLTEAEIVTWTSSPATRSRSTTSSSRSRPPSRWSSCRRPYAGTVAELLVPGETVDVGTPIIAVSTGQDAAAADARGRHPGRRMPRTTVPRPKADEAGRAGPDRRPGARRPDPVLVGYGPRTTAAKRRPRKRSGAGRQLAGCRQAASRARPARCRAAPGRRRGCRAGECRAGRRRRADRRDAKPLAKPPVRKLAKDLGVDLAARHRRPVRDGTITRDDVAGRRAGRGRARGRRGSAAPRPGRRASARPGSRSRASAR